MELQSCEYVLRPLTGFAFGWVPRQRLGKINQWRGPSEGRAHRKQALVTSQRISLLNYRSLELPGQKKTIVQTSCFKIMTLLDGDFSLMATTSSL